MLHHLGRRALDLVIGMFALLGFFYVPLGRHTGFEHVKAIVATGPATEAYRGFVAAGQRLHQALWEKIVGGRAHRFLPEQGKATSESAGPAMLGIAPVEAGGGTGPAAKR